MRLIALLLGAALLAGCGAAPDPPREPRPVHAPDDEADVGVDPSFLRIPRIDAESSLLPLGLTDVDCAAEPPCLEPPPLDPPSRAGWYAGERPDVDGDEWQPGEPGPAVIAGHVDGIGPDGRKGYPGIFARLDELVPGDEIWVERDDGFSMRFVVDRVGTFPKNAFPTAKVYGATSGPELRLITCAGAFSGGHYRDNVIVWATLAA